MINYSFSSTNSIMIMHDAVIQQMLTTELYTPIRHYLV